MKNKIETISGNKKRGGFAKKKSSPFSQKSLLPKKSEKKLKNKPKLKDSTNLKNHPIKRQNDKNSKRYLYILEHINDGCFEVDLAGNFTFFNDSVCRVLGYSREDMIGMNYRQYTGKEDVEKISKAYNKVYKTGEPLKAFDWQVTRKDGEKRNIEGSISLRKDSLGNPIGFLGIANDITERKQTEDALKKSEEKYRHLFENAPAGIYRVDFKSGKFLSVNKIFCEYLGYSQEEALSMSPFDILTEESKKLFLERMEKMAQGMEVPNTVEFEIVGKNGKKSFTQLHTKNIYDAEGHIVGSDVVATDMPERKRVDEKMRESEKLYKTIFENTGTATLIISEDNLILLANTEFERLTGYTKEDVENKKRWTDFIVKEDLEKMMAQHRVRLNNPDEALKSYEFHLKNKAGEIRNILLFLDMIRSTKQTVCSLMDITERKWAEEALRMSEEKYRNIFENAQEGIYQSTPEGRFILANQSMARILGYDSPADLFDSITDIAHQLYVDSGERKKFIEMMEQQSFARNNEVRFYRKDGGIIWVSRTMHLVRDEKGNVLYYEGLIEDITEKKESVERLRNALGGTVRAVASMVETRDPYTAGHQRHVSDLACAIATEMGLSNDQIEGLRVAAVIHDIGKASVPAEILSKPTKLTDIEFSLIKTHAQAGYDILNDIDFPWPVARIVFEHHERINGTGYPRNLKGDDIIIEARILAVADVVDAMASHRPYRASLGIKAALEEIEKNKGIFYDENVADACLKLFHEKGYQLV